MNAKAIQRYEGLYGEKRRNGFQKLHPIGTLGKSCQSSPVERGKQIMVRAIRRRGSVLLNWIINNPQDRQWI